MADVPSDKQLSELLGGGESESTSGVDFGYYLHLLLRYIWLFLAIALICAAVGAYMALRQPEKYTATAVIQVEQQEQRVLKTEETVRLESPDFLTTFVATLTGDSFLVRVAKAANLLNDPEFFAPRPEPYTDAEIADRMRSIVSAEVRKVSTSLTRLIDVSVTDTDPKRAELIAGTLVKEFTRQAIEQRMAAAQVANDFLRDEAEKLKTKLETSEQKLQKYKEEQNAVSLQEDQNITVQKLKELNAQVGEAKNQRIKLESDLDRLKRIPATDLDQMLQIPSVSGIEQVQALRAQIVTAEANLAATKKRYLPQHPQTIQATTQLEELRSALSATLKNAGETLNTQYQAAVDAENKLNEALKEQEQDALDLNKIAIPYNVLQREVDSDRAMYDAINARLRETNVSLGVESIPFRIVQEPLAAKMIPRPLLKWLGLGLFIGIALGAGTIFGLDMLDSSLRYVDQAENFLKLPVLAVVSELESQRGDKIPSVFPDTSHSQQAEAFRHMRTTLSLLGDEAHRRSFLVTSAIPGEGKTFCAYNAAMAFAAEGQKTVLVDADLRMPAVHRIFSDSEGARRHLGLSDYLGGETEIDRIIMAGPQENLSAICAGGKTSNPGELLGTDGFVTLMKILTERFDRVIIDSAPVNAVSDTLRITPLADYVCLVVRAAKTPKKALARGKKLIENARGKLAGFILNRVHLGRDSAYHFYHYAYGHSDTKAARGSKKSSAGGHA
jgi:polysaccharide biosynthesis transport protein